MEYLRCGACSIKFKKTDFRYSNNFQQICVQCDEQTYKMEETGSDDLSDFNDDKKRKNNIEKTNKLNKKQEKDPQDFNKKKWDVEEEKDNSKAKFNKKQLKFNDNSNFEEQKWSSDEMGKDNIHNNSKSKEEYENVLDTIYIETTTEDNQARYWDCLSEFVICYRISHVAIGILDLGSVKNPNHPNIKICGVLPDSLIVSNFFRILSKAGAKVRISIHPYDGFAGSSPFYYRTFTKLRAVMIYIYDINILLKELHYNIQITGIVVGESMGGNPYKGNSQSVNAFRNEADNAGLNHLLIGSAAGDIINMGLDEKYEQIYDWTYYNDKENPNFWRDYRNDPKGFFKALEAPKVNSGWNEKPPKSPWSMFKNYYNEIQKKWLWQINRADDQNNKIRDGLRYMVALNVPEKTTGLQKRLSSWTWDSIMDFFNYVKNAMKSKYKFALYFDGGLKPFH